MGVLHMLDDTGDSRMQWDSDKPEQVEEARKRFAEFRAKGWPLFRANASGDKGEQIDQFDPAAERIFAIPPMVGG